MDAYVFAYCASSNAQSAAVSAVSSSGPARVALPATGTNDRNLYVAVEGSNALELTSRVAQILAVTGMGGTDTCIPSQLGSPPPFLVPTHGAVNTWIGLGIVVCSPSDMVSVHNAIAQVSGVIGLAVITGAGPLILVEVTASTQASVGTMLDNVEAVTGVDQLDRIVGERANGAGFTSI